MKEGWTYKKLGEICKLYQPHTISSKEMVEDGKYNVFGANGIIGKYNKYNHEEPEILMTCRGATCGNINVSTPKSWINGNAMVVHIEDERTINKSFLIYILSHIDKAHIITGAAQPQITRQTLSPLIICYPELVEQQRIVEYLDAAFAQIDELKANAEKQLAEARALFQSALTQVMQPKPGWQEKSLGEIATDMYRGSGIHRDQVTQEGIPCVRYGEIYTTYNISFENCVSHTQESFLSSPKYFEHGDLLFAITGESVEDIGKTIVYMGNEKCLLGGDIICMKHKQNPKFLSYALSTADAIRQKGLGKTKLKVVHTNAPSLKAIRIPLPTLAEQQEIVEYLDSLSANIQELEDINQRIKPECDALKQALLRQIFE